MKVIENAPVAIVNSSKLDNKFHTDHIMDLLNIVIKIYYHTRKSKNIIIKKRKNIKMITEK